MAGWLMPTTKATAPCFRTGIAYLTGIESSRLRESSVGRPIAPRRELGHEEYRSRLPAAGSVSPESHGGEGRIRAAASRLGSRWKSSTLGMLVASNATPSHIWAPWILITAHLTTSCFGPACTGKTHLAVGLAIRARVRPVIGCCSPPPPDGWHGSELTTPGASTPNPPGFAAIRSWWLTKSATIPF